MPQGSPGTARRALRLFWGRWDRIARRRRGEGGQSVVEFVLLFPFAILFILFVIEFGFVLHTYLRVTQASAEGARFAAVGNLPGSTTCTGNDGTIRGRVVHMSGGIITCANVTVRYQPTPSAGPVERGDVVGVNVVHTYAPVTGIGGIMGMLSGGTFPSTIPIGACFEARMELTPATQTGMTSGTAC
jgi:Flp pilus assembly protein TadG